MPSDEDPARAAADILLDLLSVGTVGSAQEDREAACERAGRELGEIGAISAATDPDTHEIVVDATPLIAGALQAIEWLVEDLAAHAGSTWRDVVLALRQALDEDDLT